MAQIKTVPAVLKRARALLAAKVWIQCSMAEDKDGNPISVSSRKAVGFCALGAVLRAAGKDVLLYRDARRALQDTVGTFVVAFNDSPSCTKAKILDLFDRTIARLAKEGRDARR